MARIFLSYSRENKQAAHALKNWLQAQDPDLADDIFMDVDQQSGIRPGEQWRNSITRAIDRCEVLIGCVSPDWETSTMCQAEYMLALSKGKRVIPVHVVPMAEVGSTADLNGIPIYPDSADDTVRVDATDFSLTGLHRLLSDISSENIKFEFPAGRTPYRGLEPLGEEDAAVFFGRDGDLARGMSSLRSVRLTDKTLFVISGPSGAGKSSFLRAGLLPRMRRDTKNFIVLDVVRPGRQAITGSSGLAASVYNAAGSLTGTTRAEVMRVCQSDPDEVLEMLGRLHEATTDDQGGDEDKSPPTLVLPVDQAEELFSTGEDPDGKGEASAFLDLIRTHAERDATQRIPLLVIMTIRADRFEALQTADQLKLVKYELFGDLRPLGDAEFRAVIEGPAKVGGADGKPIIIEDALVDQLVNDCQRGGGSLPLLSLTMAMLYENHRGADGTLKLADYKPDSMNSVVQSLVDEVVVGDTERKLVERAFPSLVDVEPGTNKAARRVARWDEFDEDVKTLLNQLVAQGLLSKAGGDETIEVAFEGLFERWGLLNELIIRQGQDIAQAGLLNIWSDAWKRDGDRGKLLQGDDVTKAVGFIADGSPLRARLESARPYIEASQRAESQRRFRNRVIAALTVLLIVVMLGTSGWGFYNHRQTQAAQQAETGMRLVAEADQMMEGGRPGGDVLALQQLVVASKMGARSADSVANRRRDLDRIMENPDGGNEQGVTPVRAVALSPAGDDGAGMKIAAANDDGTLRIWDADTGALDREIKVVNDGLVLSVAFSPDGKFVATGDETATMNIWDAATGERVGVPMHHGGKVLSVVYSPDGALVATGGEDGFLTVWDASALYNRPLVRERAVADVRGTVRAVAFRPAAKLVDAKAEENHAILATGNDDGVVQLWDARTGAKIGPGKLAAPNSSIMSLAFGVGYDPVIGELPRVAVGLIDGEVQVLDGNTLDLIRGPVLAHPGVVTSVAFSPGGSRVVSGGTDNTVRVWDVGGGVEKRPLTPIGAPLIGHHGTVSSVAFNGDTTQIVSGGMDGSVRIWDAIAGLPIPAQQGNEVRALAFNPADAEQMASGGTDGTVKLWNPTSAAPIGQLGEPVPPQDDSHTVNVLAYSPDGTRIVAGGQDGVLRLWDVNVPAEKLRFGLKRDQAKAEVHLGADNRIKAVAYSGDGSLIVTGDWKGGVRLWDGHTLAEKGYQAVRYQIWSVVFSADSEHIVTGSGYNLSGNPVNQIQFWRVDRDSDQGLVSDGDPITGPPGWNIYALAFSPDGSRVASGANDGITRLWNSDRTPAGPPLGADQNTVSSLAFMHHRPWLITGGSDGKVRLWDVAAFRPLGSPIDARQTWIHSVAVNPDDTLIASAGADGTIHLWRVPPDLVENLCSKINANMSVEQWNAVVGNSLRYQTQCEGLPIPK